MTSSTCALIRMRSSSCFCSFLLLVRAEDDWSGFLGGLPATLFVWLFAVALTFRERRRA